MNKSHLKLLTIYCHICEEKKTTFEMGQKEDATQETQSVANQRDETLCYCINKTGM